MSTRQELLKPLRAECPRLYHAAGDEMYTFAAATDPVRKRILGNILADCEELERRRPIARIPLKPDSPHPFHQLNITFYTGIEAATLIEQYSFAWRMTGDERWLKKAKHWLRAATGWEHSDSVEEHFYTANRYMQAFAAALDWLAGALTDDEEERIVQCLGQLLQRWWPDVNTGRHSPQAGHHSVVDTGHFGVGALQMLDRHPDAAQWVQGVIDRFRGAIMPNGCGKDGQSIDGPTFWGAENAWMLQFCDALRNVTGIDLYQEFPHRVRRPLTWVRYYLAPPARMPGMRFPPANANFLSGAAVNQLDSISPVLMRFAQEAGDEPLWNLALRDPLLGRIHRFAMGIKGVPAECMTTLGPYAYLWYDPDFKRRKSKVHYPLSRIFAGTGTTRTAVLRSGWDTQSLVAKVSAFGGTRSAGGDNVTNLHLQWAGHPLLQTIAAAESSPVFCGSLPCVGGQNEYYAKAGTLKSSPEYDVIHVEAQRTRHEYWLLRGPTPVLIAALRRRPRGVKIINQGPLAWARLDGGDYLQYPREPHFNSAAGQVRLRARLEKPADSERPQILFSTGMSIPGTPLGSGVNSFNLGVFKETGLTFMVQNQRFHSVSVSIPKNAAQVEYGRWHDIAARWGGLNDPAGKPFIEVELDGRVERLDDADVFGQTTAAIDGMKPQQRRTFYVKPNTVLAFGAAVQLPDTGTQCDLSRIELSGPGRRTLKVDFHNAPQNETGSSPMVWKLNPVELIKLASREAVLGAGPGRIVVRAVLPRKVHFEEEIVPYYFSGFAAGSHKNFLPERGVDAHRLLISTSDDLLVLAFLPRGGKTAVRPRETGFTLNLPDRQHEFRINPRGPQILTLT